MHYARRVVTCLGLGQDLLPFSSHPGSVSTPPGVSFICIGALPGSPGSIHTHGYLSDLKRGP